MPEPISNYLAALTQLTEKVAVELVYASSGKDDGLLPINSLLAEMEEIAAQSPLLSNPALAGAAILGDGRVGLILDVNALVKLKGTQSLAKAA